MVFLLSIASVTAQTDTLAEPSPWKFSGATSLNMAQSSYSNWSAGGDNSIAVVAGGSVALSYTSSKWLWDNTQSVAYGLLYQVDDMRKTDDRLELTSKLGYSAAKHWRYSLLGQFRSQFDKGYKSYPVKDKNNYTSNFFSPAYATLSLGMDYTPQKNFSFYMSPLTIKGTIVLDDSLSLKGAYNVTPGRHAKFEFGAFAKFTYIRTILEKVQLKSKLEFFSNLSEKPQNVDVNLEIDMNFRATKWLSAKLYVQVLYDDDLVADQLSGPSLQVKEVMGMGLSYIF